jgi:uncharacterized membrane protein
VTFAHPLPAWALLLVLFGIVIIGRLAYRRVPIAPARRRLLIGLRSATLLLLVLFLMRPVRTVHGAAARPVVPILIDASRSMGIADLAARPRIERARDLVTRQLLPILGDSFDTEVLAFGESLRGVAPSSVSALDRRTDIAGALAATAERYRDRPVPGIVLLSDGGETGSGRSLGDRDVTPPVFALGLGAESIASDREILSATVADAALDESRVDLDVVAVSHGHGTDPVAIRLLQNGEPLEVRRVTAVADGIPVHERFQVTPPHGSATVYTVEVPIAGGELVPENNSRSVLVQPPSRARRVLFVEGAPGFEHSFLKRAWSTDRGLEVDSIVRKGKNEGGADTFYIQASGARGAGLASGYPQQLEDLCTYDALVLANVEAAQLTRAELEATRNFVTRRGGGLLVLGSRSFGRNGLADTPIDEVLPLQLSGAADPLMTGSSSRGMNLVSLTPAGEAHPVMQLGASSTDTRKKWEAAPALAFVAPVGAPRPGATVLAVAAGTGGTAHALVAVQRYGEGRAMIFTGEAAWRWRMQLPASDRSYETFWRQALRWLALPAADRVALEPPTIASSGEQVSVRVSVKTPRFDPQPGAEVDVFVTHPGGRVERLRAGEDERPGDYVARFTPAQSGVYRMSAEAHHGGGLLGSSTGALLVGGVDREMADPRLNVEALKRVAYATGGRVIASADPAAIGALPDALRAGLPAARLSVTHDLWDNGASFAVIVALLGGEWILRRRWGLR